MNTMRKAAIEIVERLQNEGFTAYFAGGCVRDHLRGMEPDDYDIATNATPEQILEFFPRGGTVGAHFGVVLVKRRGFPFEIATFRTDGDYSDGRRPDSVSFADPEEDAERRDFTINGLFEDPVRDEIIDLVGGRQDLDAGVIRAIGDPALRFGEDYLRMIRAVRFATVLGFAIEETTWRSLQHESPNIARVAPERIRDELDKIWLHRERVKGFDLLIDSGLMKAIIPEILDLEGCDQPPEFHPEGDVLTHTRLMLSHLPEESSLPLVLSVLFHDIAKPVTRSYDEEEDRVRFHGHDKVGAEMTEAILKRLKYSNAVIRATVAAVEHHMRFIDVQRMRLSTLKRFMARDTFADELELHRVDCLGSHRKLANYDFLVAKQEEFAHAPILPEPLLTGHDLIERGVPRGPERAGLLTEAQNLQLEGKLADRESALLWLDERLGGRDHPSS